MSVPPELPKRTEMRLALRRLTNHITELHADEINMFPSDIDQLRFAPLVLDEKSQDRPAFFAPLPASFLLDPDENYDREYGRAYISFDSIPEDSRQPINCARAIKYYFSAYAADCFYSAHPKGGEIVWSPVSIGDGPYVDLYRFHYPEFGTTGVLQAREGPYSHVKTTIYNDLDANDSQILQGELLSILRVMIAQLRRARFVDHMIAPVMAFSFMGPQHARIIEAYMEGHNVVVRPSKLYDLRTKDEAVFKMLVQWYFGKPRCSTLNLP